MAKKLTIVNEDGVTEVVPPVLGLTDQFRTAARDVGEQLLFWAQEKEGVKEPPEYKELVEWYAYPSFLREPPTLSEKAEELGFSKARLLTILGTDKCIQDVKECEQNRNVMSLTLRELRDTALATASAGDMRAMKLLLDNPQVTHAEPIQPKEIESARVLSDDELLAQVQ